MKYPLILLPLLLTGCLSDDLNELQSKYQELFVALDQGVKLCYQAAAYEDTKEKQATSYNSCVDSLFEKVIKK